MYLKTNTRTYSVDDSSTIDHIVYKQSLEKCGSFIKDLTNNGKYFPLLTLDNVTYEYYTLTSSCLTYDNSANLYCAELMLMPMDSVSIDHLKTSKKLEELESRIIALETARTKTEETT